MNRQFPLTSFGDKGSCRGRTRVLWSPNCSSWRRWMEIWRSPWVKRCRNGSGYLVRKSNDIVWIDIQIICNPTAFLHWNVFFVITLKWQAGMCACILSDILLLRSVIFSFIHVLQASVVCWLDSGCCLYNINIVAYIIPSLRVHYTQTQKT